MKKYNAEILNFDGTNESTSLSISESLSYLESDKANVVLLDILSDTVAESWWQDKNFPDLNSHKFHTSLRATGITLGQLQRTEGCNFVKKMDQYFESSKNLNKGLKKTKFIEFLSQEANATTYKLNDEREFMLATKRSYPRYTGDKPFSFAPHCDVISFARDPELWPLEEPKKQYGVFLTIQGAVNESAFTLWDHKPASREELDKISKEYEKNHNVGILNQSQSISVVTKPGQLCLFNSRALHAIDKCESERRTIGTFLINNNGWKICH